MAVFHARFRLTAGLSAVLLTGFLVAVHTTEPKVATVDLNRWYVLVNGNSGPAMDGYNFATNGGASVVQWSRGDTQNQQWRFLDSGNGYYRPMNRTYGKILDDYQRSTADGTDISSPRVHHGLPLRDL